MQRVVSLNLRRYSRDPVPGTRYLSKFSSKFSFFDRKSDFTYDMPGNSNCTSNRQLYVIDRLLDAKFRIRRSIACVGNFDLEGQEENSNGT